MTALRLLLGTALLLAFLVPGAGPAGAQEKKEDQKAPPPAKKVEQDPKEAMSEALDKAENEYRLYFKRPVTVAEFWAAITFEIDVGKFDVAGVLIDKLLKKEPVKEVDEELARVEQAKGMSAILRLRQVRKWYDSPPLEKDARRNVETLIGRVTAAVERRLGDATRLNRLIAALAAPTAEERSYALVQLKRAGDRATPYLADALQRTVGTPAAEPIVATLLRLDSNAMPPLFEVLRARNTKDAQDVDFRLAVLDVLLRRRDIRAVPYLWHLSAAPKYPPMVRDRARTALATLLETDVGRLSPPEQALTSLAQRYHEHKVSFPDARRVRLWPWDGQGLARKPVELSGAQAEQYFGLLFADQALDLDPAYRPAQQVFLELTLAGAFGRDLDQVLQKELPGSLQRLLATVDAGLLVSVLEKALTDRELAVVLPVVRALGERGEYRAALPAGEGPARGLVRALYYPDRRVQFAAAKALVRMPGNPEPGTAAQVVEVLRRFVAADPVPTALAVGIPSDQTAEVRQALKAAGFEPVLVARPREALQRLQAAADVDIVLVHSAVLPAELPFLLAQLRAGSGGHLPVLLLYTTATKDSVLALARRYDNTVAAPAGLTTMADAFKERLEEAIQLSLAPSAIARLPEAQKSRVIADLKRTRPQLLSTRERRLFAQESLDLLWQMGRGEVRGYDLRPARQAVEKVLRSPDMGGEAVEILGRLPGAEPQQRLALMALDPSAAKLRVPAARALNRHVRTHGVLLTPAQVDEIRRHYADAKELPEVRSELALVLGQLHTGSRLTGQRLRDYRAEPSPAPKKEK